jgi:uncharacterized protein YciI
VLSLTCLSSLPSPVSSRHYAVHYSYVPDAFEKRVPFRPGHLALTAKYKSTGKMLMGGAYTEPPMGALLTFCEDTTQARSCDENERGRLAVE